MMLCCKRLHKFFPRRCLRHTLRCFSRNLQFISNFCDYERNEIYQCHVVAEHCWHNRQRDCWRQLRAVRYRPS